MTKMEYPLHITRHSKGRRFLSSPCCVWWPLLDLNQRPGDYEVEGLISMVREHAPINMSGVDDKFAVWGVMDGRIRRGRHAIWERDTPDINFMMQGLSTYRRPKGMHRRHYERRVRKQYDAEQVFLRALLVVLRRRYRGER